MVQPSRLVNEQRRKALSHRFAPLTRNVDRGSLRVAPFALKAYPSEAQRQALIDQALELGAPPGLVIARQCAEAESADTVEVLSGWERVEAYLDNDAFPHAKQLPIALVDASDADAAFYAIEYADAHHKAYGYRTSPIHYAVAAQAAIDHFNQSNANWTIQAMANALGIARPTLSNRLRLLNGLQPQVKDALQAGHIKPEFAKILLAEKQPARQIQLAEQAKTGKLRTRELYALVHPDYTPPNSAKPRRQRPSRRLGDTLLVERALQDTYGAPAKILEGDSPDAEGRIELSYFSLSELKGLVDRLYTHAQTDALFKGEIALRVSTRDKLNALLNEMQVLSEPLDDPDR